jgi:4a-hydroxytetrahydrobiopterin dehydratase
VPKETKELVGVARIWNGPFDKIIPGVFQAEAKGGAAMTPATTDLARKHCVPCEGGVPALEAGLVQMYLYALPHWHLTADGKRLRREYRVKDFLTALEFFGRIGAVAEAEDHHPDLHLVGYRNVALEIWTHAIGGLSENDFILAAKIDQLPVALKE